MDTRTALYEAPQIVRYCIFGKLTLKQDVGTDLAMSQGCETNANTGSNAACLS